MCVCECGIHTRTQPDRRTHLHFSDHHRVRFLSRAKLLFNRKHLFKRFEVLCIVLAAITRLLETTMISNQQIFSIHFRSLPFSLSIASLYRWVCHCITFGSVRFNVTQFRLNACGMKLHWQIFYSSKIQTHLFTLKNLQLNVINKHQNWSRPWMSAMTVQNYCLFLGRPKRETLIFKNKHTVYRSCAWWYNAWTEKCTICNMIIHHSRNGIQLKLTEKLSINT